MCADRKKHVFSQAIKKQLAYLSVLDNWHAGVALLYDYLVIGLAIALYFIHPAFYIVSLILIGSRQRALATVLHESVHCSLAQSRALNQFMGTYLSGYLIFHEYYTYRDSHVKKHHAHLGDAEHDPDFQFHIEKNLYSTFPIGLIKNITTMTLLHLGSYLIYVTRHRIWPNKKYPKPYFRMYLLWTLIAGIFCYYGLGIYLIGFWFVPLLTSFALVGWFNELAEHYPLVQLHQTDLYMTRNRFSHWLEHFIFNTHNENYHLIHHLHPSIPFWNLKKAHQVLSQDAAYAGWNQKMGGIFWSSNQNKSLIQQISF